MERIFNAAVEAARAGEDIQYPGGPFLKAPAQKQQFAFPANLSTFGFWELFRRSKFLNFSMKLACGLSCSRFDFYPGDIF
jgi:hypothetical protein